jgi:hypothetical protein
MEEDDGDDTRNYLITRENQIYRQYVPDKYMRVCYFANWAGSFFNIIFLINKVQFIFIIIIKIYLFGTHIQIFQIFFWLKFSNHF